VKKFITEPERNVEIVHETDVLVVGSGPGGLSAALAAARTGVKVTLVERFGCFGGNITVVGVEGLAWYRHEKTIEAGGIVHEFEERAKAMGAAVPESQSTSYELDSERFKLVADKLVQEADIHPMLHRLFVSPIIEENTIKGIIVESKSGREAIMSKRIIDATGDADIASRCGAPLRKTLVEEMMAASVMFHLSGVDKKAFMKEIKDNPQTYSDWTDGEWEIETSGKEDKMFSPFLKAPFKKAINAGIIKSNLNTISGTWGAIHDTGELTYMNLVHLTKCDGTNADSLTHFEIEGRKQAIQAIEALRRYAPGCSNARLRNFGTTIGIRDTRKIDAIYNLTEENVRGQAKFEDSIGIFPEFIDGYGVLVLPTTGRYMQIPYRSILPKKISNLLVVGRAIGGDKIAHASTRNMACCVVTGQGGGIAAALSVKNGKPLNEVNMTNVQKELQTQNVRFS
jgi:ribulose 1,5-bisphosphate synthetase/thiazole synthase